MANKDLTTGDINAFRFPKLLGTEYYRPWKRKMHLPNSHLTLSIRLMDNWRWNHIPCTGEIWHSCLTWRRAGSADDVTAEGRKISEASRTGILYNTFLSKEDKSTQRLKKARKVFEEEKAVILKKFYANNVND